MFKCVQVQSLMQTSRRSDRRRQFKAGIIVFNNRNSTLPCKVRDISETGARIEVGTFKVPDLFELLVEMDGMTAHCAVVWRERTLIGVRFLAPPVFGRPKRIQVIQPVVPGAKPSLRKVPKKN